MHWESSSSFFFHSQSQDPYCRTRLIRAFSTKRRFLPNQCDFFWCRASDTLVRIVRFVVLGPPKHHPRGGGQRPNNMFFPLGKPLFTIILSRLLRYSAGLEFVFLGGVSPFCRVFLAPCGLHPDWPMLEKSRTPMGFLLGRGIIRLIQHDVFSICGLN